MVLALKFFYSWVWVRGDMKSSYVVKLKVIQPPVAYPEVFRHLPVHWWSPKLGAQIKGELMQNNISHLIISSTQICQHVLRHLI